MLTWQVAVGAIAIGAALGLLGGGGGILTVPMLVYGAGLDPKIAVAASLPVVGIASLIGTYSHWREHNVRTDVALSYGIPAMLGAFLGARVAAYIAGPLQLVLLSIVMLAAATRMYRSTRNSQTEDASGEPLSVIRLAPIAFAVGVLTGLLGIGGGFLVVPTLVLFVRLPMRVAVGTSLFVIALNSVAGIAGYVGRVAFPWAIILPFAAIAVVSIVVASRYTSRIPQAHLRRAFAMLLVLVAGLMLFQNRQVILSALHR